MGWFKAKLGRSVGNFGKALHKGVRVLGHGLAKGVDVVRGASALAQRLDQATGGALHAVPGVAEVLASVGPGGIVDRGLQSAEAIHNAFAVEQQPKRINTGLQTRPALPLLPAPRDKNESDMRNAVQAVNGPLEVDPEDDDPPWE